MLLRDRSPFHLKGNMAKETHLKYVLLLLALAYVFLMLGNGVLEMTNPDEVFYAQTARQEF